MDTSNEDQNISGAEPGAYTTRPLLSGTNLRYEIRRRLWIRSASGLLANSVGSIRMSGGRMGEVPKVICGINLSLIASK